MRMELIFLLYLMGTSAIISHFLDCLHPSLSVNSYKSGLQEVGEKTLLHANIGFC